MMVCTTLFNLAEACWILAAAGILVAALAIAGMWRVASHEARRRGLAKTAAFAVLSAIATFWAGGKGGARGPAGPERRQTRAAAPGLRRYFAPTNFVAEADVFTRPTNAVTPAMWTRHSVSDDFQLAAPGWVAGTCGVVTTQPWGIDSPSAIGDGYETFAPLYATNAFLLGTSDFWAVTNESSKTFVWKDLAFGRSATNLVSFAATVYDWGDFEFTYGNVPEGGFSSFVKLGAGTLDLTPYVASGQTVRVEKNLEQDAEWWLENYPEICYTNETGELVFDYDTNEWCFVQFVIESLEDYLEEEERYCRYWDACLSLSNDIVRIEKYSVEVYNVGTNGEISLSSLGRNVVDGLIDTYGEHIDLDGIAVDEIPEGVSSNDVVFWGVEGGNTTNIMNWKIEDYSRAVQKVGNPPELKLVGVDEETHASSLLRSLPDDGVEINLRLHFAVPLGSALYVTQNTHQVGAWLHRKRGTGVVTIPCRSGLKYCAYADHGFNREGTLTNDNSIAWRYANNNRRLYFHRKLSLGLAGVDLSTANFATARAVMTPPVTNVATGTYCWNSSGNIRVVPISDGRRAGVFRESSAAGFVKCIWDNGENGKWNLCATGEVSVAANEAYTNLAQFVDFRSVPRLLVFEDAHLGTDGLPVPASSNLVSSLSCGYGGNRPGTLVLSQESGPDVVVSENGAAVSMPFSWVVEGGGMSPARVFAVAGLQPGDSVTFRLRFTSEAAPGGIDWFATIHAVSLSVCAQRTWPAERHRRVFGPMEPFLLSVPDGDANGTWAFLNAGGTGNSFGASLPATPTNVAARLTIYGETHEVPLAVIAPTECVGTNAVPMTDADWMAVSSNALAVGEIGAGLRIDLKLLPDYVSFEGLRTMEGISPTYGQWGYFANFSMTNIAHNASIGAWCVNTVHEGNDVGFDRAGFSFLAEDLPRPWSRGGFEYRIPLYWWVDGSTQTNLLATHAQQFGMFPDGDSEVSKFGWTAHRGTNGVQTVERDAQP